MCISQSRPNGSSHANHPSFNPSSPLAHLHFPHRPHQRPRQQLRKHLVPRIRGVRAAQQQGRAGWAGALRCIPREAGTAVRAKRQRVATTRRRCQAGQGTAAQCRTCMRP